MTINTLVLFLPPSSGRRIRSSSSFLRSTDYWLRADGRDTAARRIKTRLTRASPQPARLPYSHHYFHLFVLKRASNKAKLPSSWAQGWRLSQSSDSSNASAHHRLRPALAKGHRHEVLNLWIAWLSVVIYPPHGPTPLPCGPPPLICRSLPRHVD